MTRIVQNGTQMMTIIQVLAKYLNSLGAELYTNHSLDNQLIAINLPHFEACAKQVGVSIASRMELNELLPKGKLYQFIDRKVVRSGILNKSVKCLIFRKGENKS